MTLGEFRKYLLNGKLILNHSQIKNILIESREYIPEINLKPSNFVSKNPLDLQGDILNREVIGIDAFNNQVIVTLK